MCDVPARCRVFHSLWAHTQFPGRTGAPPCPDLLLSPGPQAVPLPRGSSAPQSQVSRQQDESHWSRHNLPSR